MKKSFYLGIDIGGTKITAVLLQVFRKRRVRTVTAPTPRRRTQLIRLLGGLVAHLGAAGRLAGVGIGIAGVVDPNRGAVSRAANLPWLDSWNARREFKAVFRAPVRIDNDVRCFLRAEAGWGAARGKKDVIAVAIGTGIGGGIMMGGKIIYGAHGSAGEVGHMIIKTKNQRPKTKNTTWEKLAAKRAFERWGDRSEILGIGVANLINAFDPELVILGGGAVRSPAFRLSVVRRMARRHIISSAAKKTPILPGRLGETAQAIGAALLFQRNGVG